MNGFLDIYSLIFLVIAAVIFWRLRSVLGRRTGNERRPYDPYSRPEEGEATVSRREARDNVVTLGQSKKGPPETTPNELDAIAPRGSALNAALSTILSADRSFDPETFLQGARSAYEMIVEAFASGDRETLKMLLGPEVLSGFLTAIEAREARGERMESTFVGIDKAEITEAALRGRHAQITVRFVSQLISVTRDAAGEVVEGDAAKVREVNDLWTFARDIRSRDPNWNLVATEAEE